MPAKSWREALIEARETLAEAGVDSAALDARLLVADAFATDAAGLLSRATDPVDEAGATTLATHMRRRLGREPVARILGTREFWGLPFRLAPDTLEPRPDTETIVEAALARRPDRHAPAAILDLGTGTGCLLVALLHELPNASGIGIDRSLGAARMARLNASANGVGARSAFLCGDWAQALAGRFDLIVSNPPYIAASVIPELEPEVTGHDPLLALDGGRDGLDAYRAILPQLPRLLAPCGSAILEIGFDQAEALRRLAADCGLRVQEVRRDLGGRERAATLVPRENLV